MYQKMKQKAAAEKKPGAHSRLFDFMKTKPRSRRELLSGEASASSLAPSSRSSAHQGLTGTIGSTQHERKNTSNANLHIHRESRGNTSHHGNIHLGDTHRDQDGAHCKSLDQTLKHGHKDAQGPHGNKDHHGYHGPKDEEDERQKDHVDIAVTTTQHCDDAEHGSHQGKSHHILRAQAVNDWAAPDSCYLDVNTINDLEHVLKEAQQQVARHHTMEDHGHADLGSSQRAQLKRIQHLEEILKSVRPGTGPVIEFDPDKVLQCRYLRLSKSNVEQLEQMIREKGQEPGFHVHKDCSTKDIWDNLQAEIKSHKDEGHDTLKVPGKQKRRSRSRQRLDSNSRVRHFENSSPSDHHTNRNHHNL